MKTSLLLIGLLFISLTMAQSEVDKVKETVQKADIEGHIYFLADDLLKGRQTGTPELKIAASYLANQFRSYGVKPNPKTGTYYQEISFKRVSSPASASLQVNGENLEEYLFMSAAPIKTESDALYLGYGLEADYKGVIAKGKVIVIKSGSPDDNGIRTAYGLRGTKQDLAKQNGVKAIIELIDAGDAMWDNLKHNFNKPQLVEASNTGGEERDHNNSAVPHLWVLDKANEMALQFKASKTMTAKIAISEKNEEAVVSRNVIGVVEGTDPVLKEEYIIYSAHYDHVGIGAPDKTGDTIYNGARDNAVGTTTVLSMAENLAKYPTQRSALFILFTGEEMGLLGSRYYVENPVLPLEQMVFCFNSDNAGYNDTTLATIVGLTRTTAEQHILDAANTFGLTAVDDPAKEQGLFDRSDNVNFAKKGIPAPTFSLGFTAFNGDVTKYYHQPGDEAESLDYDYLVKFFRAYVMSGRAIGNDPATPVWNSGDKYEAASKTLYKSKTVKD